MKSNTTFIFAGIMSAIVGNAYATGENIVTSKSYVDSVFQTKIPATVTDDYLGLTRSLVATTDTSGQVEQIGLYDAGIMSSSDFDENTIAKRLYNDYDDFLRYDSVVPSVADMQIEVQEKWDWTQILIPQSGHQAYKDNGNWSEGQRQDW